MTYVKHVSEGIASTLAEIKARREGTAVFLPTKIKKLDDTIYGGLEPWRIAAIAGLSGSGKSTLLEQIKDNLFISAKEKNINLRVLDFSFEMVLKDSLLRVLSKRTGKSLDEIFKQYVEFKDVLAEIKAREQYVVDTILAIDEMESVMLEFCSTDALNTFTVVTIDHTLLTKSKTTELEKLIVDQLFHMLVRLKMRFSASGNKVSFMVLSQLNRDIETKDRIMNKALHYPTKNDIFSASSVYYCSDYVWIMHCPGNVTGIGSHYGMPLTGFPLGLPTSVDEGKKKHKIVYLHCIKNRFGVPNKIIPFKEEFQYSRLCYVNLTSDNSFTYD